MKYSAYFVLLLSLFGSAVTSAESISDKLIVAALNKQMPTLLYEHADQQWDLGVYSLKIERNGTPGFISTESQLILSLPIKANITGKVEQVLFGNKIEVNCANAFNTQGRIVIEPLLKEEGSTASVDVTVPIPETDLNCDGLRVPVKSVIEKLVAQKKVEWEKEMEAEINKLFSDLGI